MERNVKLLFADRLSALDFRGKHFKGGGGGGGGRGGFEPLIAPPRIGSNQRDRGSTGRGRPKEGGGRAIRVQFGD